MKWKPRLPTRQRCACSTIWPWKRPATTPPSWACSSMPCPSSTTAVMANARNAAIRSAFPACRRGPKPGCALRARRGRSGAEAAWRPTRDRQLRRQSPRASANEGMKWGGLALAACPRRWTAASAISTILASAAVPHRDWHLRRQSPRASANECMKWGLALAACPRRWTAASAISTILASAALPHRDWHLRLNCIPKVGHQLLGFYEVRQTIQTGGGASLSAGGIVYRDLANELGISKSVLQ